MNLLPEQVAGLFLKRNVTIEQFNEESDKPFSSLQKEHDTGEARIFRQRNGRFLRFSHAARIFTADKRFEYREVGHRRLRSANAKTRYETKPHVISETIHWWSPVHERERKAAIFGIQEELGTFVSEKALVFLGCDLRWPAPHVSSAYFEFDSSTKGYNFFVPPELLGLHERDWENNRTFTSEYIADGTMKESISIIERFPITDTGRKLLERVKQLRAA